MHYVYILKLENGLHYTGQTDNVERRMVKHLQSPVPTTKRYKPVGLEFYAAFKNKKKALEFERYLKSSSGNAFRNKHLL